MKLILLPIIIILSAIAGCNNPERDTPAMHRVVATGLPAPDFTLRDLSGKKITLSEYKGKVVLLNFWKMRCKDCMSSMPSLEALNQRFKDKDMVILSVNVDNLEYVKPEKIKAFLDDKHYTFKAVMDETFSASEDYKIIAVPMTYLIGREGIVSYIKFGEENWESRENIERIEALLKGR
mgnify:FL=1